MKTLKSFTYRTPKNQLSRLFGVIILCLFCKISVHAQSPSDKGWFEADAVVGCADFTINITNLGLRPGNLFVDFQGDPNDPFSTSGFTDIFSAGQMLNFTYTVPGTYLIRVVDQSGGGSTADRFDFLTIEVLDPVEPEFTVELCAGNEVALTFNFGADQYDFYEIDFGDGLPPTNLSKGGISTIIYTYASQGDYSIAVTGKLNSGNDLNCGAAPTVDISTINIIPDPIIQSLSAESETSLLLTYDPLSPIISYSIEIDQGSGFVFFSAIDTQANPTEFLIDDASIDNRTTSISVRIVATTSCTTTPVVSDEISSIAVSYELSPFNSSTIPYDYFWQTGTSDFTGMDFFQSNNLVFTTSDAEDQTRIEYAVCTDITEFYMQKIENGVLVTSLREIPDEDFDFSLPQMRTPEAELDGNNVILTFQPTLYPFSEIRVLRKDGNGDYQDLGTTNTLNYIDLNVSGNLTEACYVSDYLDECGNFAGTSEEVCVPLQGLLRVPNAFTPNGDGVNDTFDVGSGVFTNFQILIFNRWGALVYRGNDPTSGWDGIISGQEAPIGTYRYKISYLLSGAELVSTGTVTLIR